jgi:hypothetical protein
MSNFGHIYHVSEKKQTFSNRSVFQIFFNFWHDIKNEVLTFILTYFGENCGWGNTLPTPSTSSGFYYYYIPPEGVSPTGLRSAVRRGTVQNSNRYLVPGRSEGRVCRFLNWAGSLALSNWTAGAAPFWANSWNHSALWHTTQIWGEMSLYLGNVRSKLSRPWYLTVLLDPGSIQIH